jgi:predicted transcriptional regulator
MVSLTRGEFKVIEVLWSHGRCSVREIHNVLRGEERRAYSTLQNIVTRLESRGAVRVVKRISTARILEAAISRDDAQGVLINDAIIALGGDARALLFRLVEGGDLTQADLGQARAHWRLCHDHAASDSSSRLKIPR